MNGQTVVGIVTAIIGGDAIELSSRQYHEAVVRFETVEAMTVN